MIEIGFQHFDIIPQTIPNISKCIILLQKMILILNPAIFVLDNFSFVNLC
ncbi:hypothetical protein SAMN00777080_3443 [Aquiflexum balticum DSM 16537]|uniref:Uncharacterized protein n=1 Tax=Aquiflexum balticum DSM 16537 TaxID=758820 RepID=A0A1W2H7G7_9BACT|nr:hypothetical protein SAMN00777080_3443 [Aquiflexum balticum DSM 16537]